jgi:hypothetical protein
MTSARASFWSGLVVIGFAVLALVWIIPGYAGANPLAQMPPDLVPRIAAWLMLVSGLFIVAGAVAEMVRGGESLIPARLDWVAVGWALWPFLYVAAAIWLLTMFRITYVGAPLIAGMLLLYGERRWLLILGCSVVPVALLYLLSVYLMRVGVV